MSNVKYMIFHLIAGLIKKMLNEILSNAISLYKKLIYLIMQQNLIAKMKQDLIHLN